MLKNIKPYIWRECANKVIEIKSNT